MRPMKNILEHNGRTSDITEITSAETGQVLTKMKNGKATVDLINYG